MVQQWSQLLFIGLVATNPIMFVLSICDRNRTEILSSRIKVVSLVRLYAILY